jgi:hypothetical protein
LLGKSVLDADVLSLDPAKLGHFLPERRQQTRDTGSATCVEKAYAEDFPRLLCLDGTAKGEHREEDRCDAF